MKKSSIRKTWNVISSILVALVVLLALLLVGARLFGLQVYTVLSGSMEPTYHTGSLIYVKKVDPYTIRDGQVITFMLDENTSSPTPASPARSVKPSKAPQRRKFRSKTPEPRTPISAPPTW